MFQIVQFCGSWFDLRLVLLAVGCHSSRGERCDPCHRFGTLGGRAHHVVVIELILPWLPTCCSLGRVSHDELGLVLSMFACCLRGLVGCRGLCHGVVRLGPYVVSGRILRLKEGGSIGSHLNRVARLERTVERASDGVHGCLRESTFNFARGDLGGRGVVRIVQIIVQGLLVYS